MDIERRKFITLPSQAFASIIGPKVASVNDPVWDLWRPTRRELLEVGVLSIAALMTGCTENEPSIEQYTVPELQRLGQEVEQWTLKSGVGMAERFPGVKNVSDLLQGRVDPRIFLPFVDIPVGFEKNIPYEIGGQFYVKIDADPTDSRLIKVKSGRREYRVPMPKKKTSNAL